MKYHISDTCYGIIRKSGKKSNAQRWAGLGQGLAQERTTGGTWRDNECRMVGASRGGHPSWWVLDVSERRREKGLRKMSCSFLYLRN